MRRLRYWWIDNAVELRLKSFWLCKPLGHKWAVQHEWRDEEGYTWPACRECLRCERWQQL